MIEAHGHIVQPQWLSQRVLMRVTGNPPEVQMLPGWFVIMLTHVSIGQSRGLLSGSPTQATNSLHTLCAWPWKLNICCFILKRCSLKCQTLRARSVLRISQTRMASNETHTLCTEENQCHRWFRIFGNAVNQCLTSFLYFSHKYSLCIKVLK